MPGYVVVENIRRAVHTFGCVTQFKAYLEISESTSSKKQLRSELQSSGVSLTDCPHNGRKDAADKMIIVDMLTFALDNPSPATIVLISGDRDFVYALSTLRNRRYTVVLIVPNRGAHIILKSQANAILEWRYDVLNQDIEVLKEMGMIDGEEVQPRAKKEEEPISRSNVTDWRDRSERIGRALSNTNSGTATPGMPSRSVSPSKQLEKVVEAMTKLSKSDDKLNAAPSSTAQPNTSFRDGTFTPSRLETKAKALLTEEDSDIPCFSPRAPHFFDLLIEVLETFRLAGDERPRRSKVGNELVRRNPLLYNRAGVENFKGHSLSFFLNTISDEVLC